MAEYDFTAGPRKGKVYKEKYYLRNNKNFIQEAKKYIPINSQWLTKEEFKNYILSLLDKGIPQIYVLEELPEDLFPYALIFVQNEEKTSIYVDKEGIRTEIKLGGGSLNYLFVDELPQKLDIDTIYFLRETGPYENVYYDVYIYDEEELRHVEIKGIDWYQFRQMQSITYDITRHCLKNIYYTNLTANKVVITDTEGNLRAGNTDPVELDLHLYWSANGSLKNIYDKTVTADKVMVSDNNGYLATSNISSTDVSNVMTGVTTKSLKNVYNNVLQANKDIVTDANGYLTTAEKPHLYAHHYHYDHSGRGEVNFVIYSSKSTELGNSELGTYLKNLGCDESFRAYPANGQNQANGAIVTGIFIKPSGSHLVPYTICVTSYNIGSMFTEEISNYPGTHFIKIVQIF